MLDCTVPSGIDKRKEVFRIGLLANLQTRLTGDISCINAREVHMETTTIYRKLSLDIKKTAEMAGFCEVKQLN